MTTNQKRDMTYKMISRKSPESRTESEQMFYNIYNAVYAIKSCAYGLAGAVIFGVPLIVMIVASILIF